MKIMALSLGVLFLFAVFISLIRVFSAIIKEIEKQGISARDFRVWINASMDIGYGQVNVVDYIAISSIFFVVSILLIVYGAY